MKWIPDGKYCLRSEDSKYRITKTSHTSGDWQYAAIFAHRIIGTSFSAEAMKAACLSHSKGEGA